eukprot:jgi/Galph1/3961/GphlegSOOS_G2598.1
MSNKIFSSLENATILYQGAEATLYLSDFMGVPSVWKYRTVKSYRHEILDKWIRSSRLTQEARTLLRCRRLLVRVPAVYFVETEECILIMQFIPNTNSLKTYLEKTFEETELRNFLAEQVAVTVARLHNGNIIHGDLTTSNFLVSMDQSNQPLVYVIDFGLSFHSSSEEDKAVDLFVLERAVLTTCKQEEGHVFLEQLLNIYEKNANNSEAILQRLEQVRKRGRKRLAVG